MPNQWNSKLFSEAPSPLIDAAICDLISKIAQFSDDFFDSNWNNLRQEEIEILVVRLLKALTETLEGRTLEFYLQQIRQDRTNSF